MSLDKLKSLRIALAGDYFLGQGFSASEHHSIKKFIKERELMVINYEGTLPAARARSKAVNLAATRESLALPEQCLLSLANNHVLDYGQEGLALTIGEIKASDLKWFGLESRRAASDNYTIIEKGECRICFAGFGWRNEECVGASSRSPGVVNFTKRNIDRLFEKLSNETYDHLIVYVHSGYEFEYYPLPLHVGLSRYLIDHGASLVYGSHSHNIQPYEVYRGRYIFYGLGNFLFSPGHEKYPAVSDRGLIVNIRTSKDRLELEGVERIQYSRTQAGVTIGPDLEFLTVDRMTGTDLAVYGKDYRMLRKRKKNPRPIMQYQQPLVNELKYFLWLAIVRVTGYLRIRQIVKRTVGWN